MSNPDRNIRTILFDLDDTLNERRASWAAFVEVLRQEYRTHIAPCSNESMLEVILAADRGGYRPKKDLFADLSEQLPWIHAAAPSELEGFWRLTFPACMVAREGAKSVLADLRSAGYRVGIVSNGRTDMQMRKVQHLGLHDLAEVVIVSESVGFKKPQPQIYLEALSALSGSRQTTLFVGDNPELDIIGPANLGMQTAWLTLGRIWPAQYGAPDYRLSSLLDLRRILRMGVE